MIVLLDEKVSGDRLIEGIADGWVSVTLPTGAVAPVTVGESPADCITNAPIGPGSQLPYRVSDGVLNIRTANRTLTSVKVVWWGEFMPPHIQRPVVGPTAKTRDFFHIVPASTYENPIRVKVEEPSQGQQSMTTQAHPGNLGIIWISGNNKLAGFALRPGESLHMPNFNGTLQARYEAAGDESSGMVSTMKHENDWDFGFDEVA